MDVSLIIIVVITVAIITILYKNLPHRNMGEKKTVEADHDR